MGVYIDEKLTWKEHIKTLTNKVSRITGSLYSISKVIPSSLKTSVYNALVNSHLSYAISVWGADPSGNKLKNLLTVQKRCLRTLYCIKKLSKYVKGHTKRIFNDNNILVINNLYNYFTILEIQKLKLNRNPTYLCQLLKLDDRKRMYLPNLKLTHYQLNFLYQGPKLWNLIASSYPNIHRLPFIKSYKRKLKHILLNAQSYGNADEWIIYNINLEKYFVAVNNDPYSKPIIVDS